MSEEGGYRCLGLVGGAIEKTASAAQSGMFSFPKGE